MARRHTNAELRIAASKWDIKSVVTSGHNVVFSFAKEATAQAKSIFADTKGKIRIPGPKTVYLRLAASYFEPKTLITILRKILAEEYINRGIAHPEDFIRSDVFSFKFYSVSSTISFCNFDKG